MGGIPPAEPSQFRSDIFKQTPPSFMLGVIFTFVASFFEETGTAIGKTKVAKHEESLYSMGFLSLVGGALIFGLFVLLRNEAFVFSFASLPTFTTRVILEIIQVQTALLAVAAADRSTFGFVRVLTVPLLLIVDLFLGYPIGARHILGMVIIIAALLYIFKNHGLSRKGLGWLLFSTVNAVATISLFKYDITHFNSVAGEQLPMYVILILFVLIADIVRSHENPLRLYRKQFALTQTLTSGVAGLLDSFAFSFAPASIIIAAKRSSAVLFTVVSGRVTFHEKHLLIKTVTLIILILGLVFLL